MIEALLQQTNLWDVRKKAISRLGRHEAALRRRAGAARESAALIVDEPTAGLDPAERNRFLNLLSSSGAT